MYSLFSSKSDQDAKPDVDCATMSSKEVTSLENIKQDIGEEIIPKVQDEDGDVPEAKEEDDEMKEEEEVESAPTEAETPAGKDAEIQEVTGKEEHLAGSISTDVKAEDTPATEEAEDGLGNRFVMFFLVNWILTQCLPFYLLKY